MVQWKSGAGILSFQLRKRHHNIVRDAVTTDRCGRRNRSYRKKERYAERFKQNNYKAIIPSHIVIHPIV
jgi:hypothetical protein